MKIKEAVKWMEEAIQETTEYFEQCSPTLQEELIKQKEVFELALTALRSMQETTKPGWISVKERLPDKGKNVIVYATAKYIGGEKTAIDRLEEGENHPIWMYTHGWFEVTHWM